MKTSGKTGYGIWLNLTIAACAVFFFSCLMGDIFGYSVCDFYWKGTLSNEGYVSCLSFLSDEKVRFYVFLTCFYLSTALTYPIIYCVLNLIMNIKKEKIFDKANTRLMTIITACCFLICLICLIGAAATYFLFVISLVGLFVGLVVQCVRLVMDKAIDMRNELDLTV